MRATKAKMLRRTAEVMTRGQQARVTRKIYQQLKSLYKARKGIGFKALCAGDGRRYEPINEDIRS